MRTSSLHHQNTHIYEQHKNFLLVHDFIIIATIITFPHIHEHETGEKYTFLCDNIQTFIRHTSIPTITVTLLCLDNIATKFSRLMSYYKCWIAYLSDLGLMRRQKKRIHFENRRNDEEILGTRKFLTIKNMSHYSSMKLCSI